MTATEILPYEVSFDEGDWYELALLMAGHRVRTAFRKGRQGAYGANQTTHRWDKDVVGCLGEWALADWLGTDIQFQDTCDYDGDVGEYHVRTTPYVEGALPIHKKDPDDGVFVHVTLDYENLRALLWGWCYGTIAKQAVPFSDKKQSGRFAYWVEIDDRVLRDMKELPGL